MRIRFLVGCLLLTAFVPLAEGEIKNPNESTPTTLYFHLAGMQNFPINTQPPDDRFGAADSKGLATHTLTCAPSAVPGLARGDHHTFYGFSTPGYVQYDVEEDGGPRIHPERGIAYDVALDTSIAPVVTWHLETHAVSFESEANSAPAVVPRVVVKATMREGDDVSVGDAAFNEGAIIAQGMLGPFDLYPATTDLPYQEVDGKHVYTYQVPLSYQLGKIRGEEGYNVRVDVFMENPLCNEPGESSAMTNQVRIHTSPGFRPRMDLAVMNPLGITNLHPQFIGDELVVHGGVNSPWGNYDVDESDQGIRLEIEGPSQPGTVTRVIANVGAINGHHNHGAALTPAWVWPYKAEGAADGLYTVRMVAINDQGTAIAMGESTFAIGSTCAAELCEAPPVTDTPGLLALLPLLAAVAWRRWSP